MVTPIPPPEVTILIHREGPLWWAESDDWPGWTAADDSLERLHAVIAESFRQFRPHTSYLTLIDPMDILENNSKKENLPDA